MNKVELIKGDCLEKMKDIPDRSIDLIIADPPYFEIVKEDWDNMWVNEDDYYNWCKLWIKEFSRIIKLDGKVYMWNWFDNICSLGYFAKQEGFFIKNLITWNRGAGRERYNWCSAKEELLFLSLNKEIRLNIDRVLLDLDNPNRKMKKSSWERCQYERKDRKNFKDNKVNPSNVWFDNLIAYNSKEKVEHPTQKPLSICDRIIISSSNEGDLIYIPFAGSGSEIISSIKNNRNCIANEIKDEYIKLIKNRIKENFKEDCELVIR